MTRALLLTSGSRGDTEPLLSLAATLAASSAWEHVAVCAEPEYMGLVPRHPHISAHELPYGMQNFAPLFQGVFVRGHAEAKGRPVDFAALLSEGTGVVMADVVMPSAAHMLRVCEEKRATVVVTTYMTWPIAVGIAEKLAIPACVVHLQPQVPTALFPLWTQAAEAVETIRALQCTDSSAVSNEELRHELAVNDKRERFIESYLTPQRIIFDKIAEPLNCFRESIGLSSFSFADMRSITTGHCPRVTVANAFPPYLVPSCHDFGPRVHQVGPLADTYIPPGWYPDAAHADLVHFFESGAPPVCASYGSMELAGAGARVSHVVLKALRAAGVERAVLLAGDADLGPQHLPKDETELRAWASAHVYHCKKGVPYAWLLPKCSMFMSHGGAGSVSAAIRAGIPIVLSPQMGDQDFWAKMVSAHGLGVMVEVPESIDASQEFENAIRIAQTPKMKKNAAEMKSKLGETPNGVEKMEALLRGLVDDKSR